MGGSSNPISSIAKPFTDVISAVIKPVAGAVGIGGQQPAAAQAEQVADTSPTGAASTVISKVADAAQKEGADQEAEVTKGTGKKPADPTRSRAKFRTPNAVSVGGTTGTGGASISI